MSAGRTLTLLSRLVEGAGIALDSLRSNKVRAALTVLGVAIGVMVVIAMGSAINGINRSITGILESAGPKTFWVVRYFQGGQPYLELLLNSLITFYLNLREVQSLVSAARPKEPPR